MSSRRRGGGRRRRAPRALAAAAGLAAAALGGGGPTLSAAAVHPPATQAEAAVLVEAGSGEVLVARNATARRAIASATKLMTALLALERAEPGTLFTAAAYDALPVESKIGLRAGERMTVDDLLVALLLESANDAAVTIAENVSGSRRAFVREMNRRARQLGLSSTSFGNPIGLDDPENFSSARDLARLTRRLLRNRRFATIVDRPRAALRSGARTRVVGNRNTLVGRFPFVDGVKTGHTIRAGYVLVGAASRRGVRVVSVVLGEPSEAARDRDTVALLRYGLDRFRRLRVLAPRRVVARPEIEGRDGARATLVPATALSLTVRRGERPGTRVSAPAELEGPLPAGRRVGSVQVVYRGRVVRTVPLVTGSRVPAPSTPSRLMAVLAPALTSLLVLAMVIAVTLVATRRRAVRRDREGTAAR